MDPNALTPVEHQAYVSGQLIGVTEMNRARDAGVVTRELQTRLVMAPGVLFGLQVTAVPGGTLTVAPGVALDPLGRQLLLVDEARWQGQPVVRAPDGLIHLTPVVSALPPGTSVLVLTWNQEPAASDPTVLVDVPLVASVAVARQEMPANCVVIATLAVDPETLSVAVNDSGRQPATIRAEALPPLDASAITSGTLDAVRVPQLADLSRRVAALEAALPPPPPAPPAPPIGDAELTWDLSTAQSDGDVTVALSQQAGEDLMGKATQTGGGPAESFQGGPVLITRCFGTQYPFIALSAGVPVLLTALSFRHFHNHNPNYPSYPSYPVQVQLDSGAGYVDVGAAVVASPETSGTSATVDLGGTEVAAAGKVRWLPRDLAGGAVDTGTEYYALDSLTLVYRLADPPVG